MGPSQTVQQHQPDEKNTGICAHVSKFVCRHPITYLQENV